MPPRMWQFTHCPNDLSPAIISATMSRLRVLNVYSADGVLNQRTLQVPVNGLTLSVHTLREMLGEVQEMSIMDSVAVGDVPDAPVIVTGGAAAFTLSPLLFEHLQGDAFEIVVAGIDAVVIEERLRHWEVGWFHESSVVHAFIIGGAALSWSRGRPLRQASPSPSALLPVCLVSRSWRHRLPQMRDGRRRSCWWHSRNRSDRSRTSRRVALQICSCCFVELFGDVVCHERAGSIWYGYLLP